MKAIPPTLNVSLSASGGISCPYFIDAVKQVGYRFQEDSFVIKTNDPERKPDILITVTELPSYGSLLVDARELRNGDRFEMRLVDEGAFYYKSTNRTAQIFRDGFTLNFELGSTTALVDVPICIDPVPKPLLTKPVNTLRVPVNGTVHISSGLLEATDTRGGLYLEDLEYVITIGPQYGQVVNRTMGNHPVTSFTQLDVNNNHIAYIHQAENPTRRDFFTFKLKNLYFTLPPVRVEIENFLTSVKIVNTGFSVPEGDSHVIMPDHFQVYTPPGFSAFITITELPLKGQLLFDSKRLDTRSLFITPSDITAGLLVYQHDDSEHRYDSFEFEVCSNVTDPITLNMYPNISEWEWSSGVVNITIILRNDNRPVQWRKIDLNIWEGEEVVINGEVLAYHDEDLDDPDELLNYTLNSQLDFSRCGYLFFKEKPGVPVSTFLQADIFSGRLWYHHNRSSSCPYYSTGYIVEHFLFDVSCIVYPKLYVGEYYLQGSLPDVATYMTYAICLAALDGLLEYQAL